jgi:glycolate oxidase iron-sulfur subunit
MTQTTSQPTCKVVSGLGEAHTQPVGLDILKLNDHAYDRALSCVHCGLCLPVCPTYTQNGLESDSPRGRIYMMKGLADGNVEPTNNVLKHLDLCLDCQACETICPSGVVYHELLEDTRAKLKPQRKYSFSDKLLQSIFLHGFTKPFRLKVLLLPVRVLQKVGIWKLMMRSSLPKMLPAQFQKMQQMLPDNGPLWERGLEAYYPPTANMVDGKPRATVAMFAGCVGSVMYQDVNRKTVELLQHLGCEVVVPRKATCCGAIHHHAGEDKGARDFAKQNIKAYLNVKGKSPQYIVNNIAGCGAGLREFDHLLRDDAQYAEKAVDFVSRVRDVCELIDELDMPSPSHRVEKMVTYHHACHLLHAQKAGDPPLRLLRKVLGLKLLPLAEADFCCGAAGTYNLTQPEMAMQLAERKIRNIQESGASVVVMSNVGCAMQIESEAKRLGVTLTTEHPVEILHKAYLG